MCIDITIAPLVLLTCSHFDLSHAQRKNHQPITLSKLNCLQHTTISSPPPLSLLEVAIHPSFTYHGAQNLWRSQNLLFPSSLSPFLPASLLEVAVLHLRSGVLPITVLTYPYLTNLLSSAPSPCSPQPHSHSIYRTHTSTHP